MRTPKSEKEKQKRLKMEVQYCRDTSARLLHSNKLFNIMKPKGQGKKGNAVNIRVQQKPETILRKSL